MMYGPFSSRVTSCSNREKRLLKSKNLQDSVGFIAGLSRFCPGTHTAESCNLAHSVLGLF